MEQALTFEQLKAQFPDEWLLLANPEFKNAKPMRGLLLAHGRDYLELCYQSQALAAGYEDSTIVFTGEPQTHNRKWLKATRLTKPFGIRDLEFGFVEAPATTVTEGPA